jgi:hypothetical protein
MSAGVFDVCHLNSEQQIIRLVGIFKLFKPDMLRIYLLNHRRNYNVVFLKDGILRNSIRGKRNKNESKQERLYT